MRAYFSDTFELPLPPGHRFPIEKYRLLRRRLEESEFADRLEFCVAEAATDRQLRLIHTDNYLNKLDRGDLSPIEERRIGFPWSPGMVERSRRSTGATIAAARSALAEGAAVHLAGGTHHAFADHGQGFCVFNDVAVAIRVLQAEESVGRSVVIDLDVHQGNGTASIFARDTSVFTFSMHGERNFPFAKCDGDLDIALPDGTGDADYLTKLRSALQNELPLAGTHMVFYLAGADPYKHDRLGKLHLTKAGLLERDRLVFSACADRELPITLVMAGGYCRKTEDIVDINMATIEALLDARRQAAGTA